MFETTTITMGGHLLPKTSKPPWGFRALKIMIAVLWVVFGMVLLFVIFSDRRGCVNADPYQRANVTQCILKCRGVFFCV